MTDELDELYNEFNRDDQEVKRDIGKYIHDLPGRWIAKRQILDRVDLDESGVSRHLSDLHENGFLRTKYGEDGQLYVRWNGRGAGGFGYWVRRAIPSWMLQIGKEIRPVFTLDTLGGAYVPTILFILLLLIGLATAIFTVIITYAPMDSIYGIGVLDAVLATGMITILASVVLLLLPIFVILDKVIEQATRRLRDWKSEEK